MRPTTFLLVIIVIMHFMVLANIAIFDGNWNGIVIAVNTCLFIIAFGMVLPLRE